MTPPQPISGNSLSESHPATEAGDIQDRLNPELLFRDPMNSADPLHLARRWESDQAFRTSHGALYLALDALRRYFSGTGDTLSEEGISTLQDWVQQSSPDEIDRLALRNLRALLAPLGGSSPRARRVLEILGPAPAEPEAEEAEEGEAERVRSSSFELAALTLGFRFDQPHRDFAHGLTIGALPATGVPGYHQAADFGWEFDGEFQWGDFRLFGGVTFNHGVTPQSAPAANFEQGFLQFGLVEYGNLIAGDRSGFYLGTGRSRVGLGIGYRVCTGLDEAATAAGAECAGDTPQLTLVNQADLISAGYGPVELSIRLLSNPFYINLTSDAVIPSYNNLVPLEYSLIYHLTPPRPAGAAEEDGPGPNLETSISDAQATFDGLRLITGAFQDHLSFRSEAALEETRILNVLGASGTIGAAAQYNLLNLGTFIGGALRGLPAGALAYELRGDLAVGTTEQRVLIGAAMGAEPLIHGLLALGGSRTDPGIPSLEEQALILSVPHFLTRDGLSILGALGAFGDRNRALEGDTLAQAHFFTAHGVLALGGLVLVLASGDGSGDGFLANSILGNSRPVLTGTEIQGTQWDLDSQRGQYIRLDVGAMLLTYGASGILDYLGSQGSNSPSSSSEPAETAGISDLRLSISTDGRTHAMIGLGGQM